MNFDQAFKQVVLTEGGYSDRSKAADPGGKTKYGITEKVARKNGYTGAMSELPLEVAETIYRAEYWDLCRCDELPDGIKFDVFDASVLSGVTQAIKWLQRSVGVVDDGAIGPVTVKACKELTCATILLKFNGQRLLFMAGLSNWDANSEGWVKRIAKNLLRV